MAVECMGAILARKFTYDPELVQWRIIEPVGVVGVTRVAGQDTVKVNLGNFVVVLVFYGGQPGQRFTISNDLLLPQGMEGNTTPYAQELTWGTDVMATYNMEFTDVELIFSKSGTLHWHFSCDGRPLRQVGLRVMWSDELQVSV